MEFCFMFAFYCRAWLRYSVWGIECGCVFREMIVYIFRFQAAFIGSLLSMSKMCRCYVRLIIGKQKGGNLFSGYCLYLFLVLHSPRLQFLKNLKRCSVSGVERISSSILCIASLSVSPCLNIMRYAFFRSFLSSSCTWFLERPTLLSPITLAGFPSAIT